MKIFQKQTTSRPLISVLLVLLLTVAICISTVGITTHINATQQLHDIGQSYTTVAIHSGANLNYREGSFYPKGEDSREYLDGTFYPGPIDSIVVAENFKDYLRTEQQLLLSAHVEGMVPLSSGRLDATNYATVLDSDCYSTSVLAAECIQCGTSPKDDPAAIFRIIDWVSLSDIYDHNPVGGNITLVSIIANEDGSPIFEAGKTYLMRGFFWDYLLRYESIDRKVRDIERGQHLSIDGIGTDYLSYPVVIPNYQLTTVFNKDYTISHSYDPGNSWPMVTEYTGNWQDFLETDEGRVWKEEIIPHVEICQNSAPVILTDMLESMYNFNTGIASILDGRTFTQEEYQQGEKVCIISAAYAQLNSLKLGDKLNLDFYDSGYTLSPYSTGMLSPSGVTVERWPMVPESHIDAKADYTIVGIYTAPEWGSGIHDFNADTIFVPKQSVSGWQTCVNGSLIPMLASVVIENGSIEEFQAHMETAGMGKAFFCFDQGYSEMEFVLLTLQKNAQRLLIISLPVFLLTALVFLLLDGRRRKNVIRSLRLLGVKQSQVWREVWSAVLVMVLAAVFAGNLLGVLFFQLMTKGLMSSAFVLNPLHVLLCAVVQFLSIATLSAVWTAVASGRDLMKRK